MNEVDMTSFFTALRPENIKKQQRENNGVAVVRLSDHFKKKD